MKKKGKVYLVGAGPGDIGLLTVKGLACLKKADAVVYDFHLNAQVLNYIKHEAEFIYAGKRGGRHSMEQDEINAVLIEKAKEGKTVCRLKGGDPFVFGRGGEEALALAEEGIPFEVVPGVSSSVAAPAYAGIPLTHRKYSSSFAVVPGYEDVTKENSSIDWPRLATGVGTLVFLMAVKNIDILTKTLIENGRAPETPVAVVRWGTRPEQKTLVSTLGEVAEAVREKDIHPPAVMVIGEVVRLRQKLKWYEEKPLFGHRVLVTREHSKGFEPLEELGAEVMEFPTIEIKPPENWEELDKALLKVSTYHWLIFTSGTGVKYFFERLKALGMDIRELKGVKICAVGKKTAEAIEEFCLKVDMVPEEFRAEGLIKAFSDIYSTLKGKKFLLPRALEAREIFPQKVKELGGEIDIPTAYRAVIPEARGKRLKRFFKEGRVTIATFTSGATFTNFLKIMEENPKELFRDVAIAVIGPVTAARVEKEGIKVDIMPGEATIEAMVEAIANWAMNKR
jgi:uroporphyrinogen III methyltransferase/synthase